MKAVPGWAGGEHHRVGRRQAPQDARIGHHLREPGQRQDTEPEQCDGAEEAADFSGAEPLRGEQQGQDHRRHRHHQVSQLRGGDLQTLNRGQDADGRGDDRVAVEQRDPQDAQHQQQGGPGPAGIQLSGQGGQGHHPAFTVVVGPHDHPDVLHGDDQRHRPHDQRHHPVDIAGGGTHRPAVDREHRMQRVQRAGTDVAEHHTKRGQQQRPATGPTPPTRAVLLRRCSGCGCRCRVRTSHLATISPSTPTTHTGQPSARTQMSEVNTCRPCRTKKPVLRAGGYCGHPATYFRTPGPVLRSTGVGYCLGRDGT